MKSLHTRPQTQREQRGVAKRIDDVSRDIQAEVARFVQSTSGSALTTAPETAEVSRKSLQFQISELQRLVAELQRPTLDNPGRTQVVQSILDGLAGFGSSQAALMAAREFNSDWFDSEPDMELRRLLATRLMDAYGTSGFGSPDVWAKYKD